MTRLLAILLILLLLTAWADEDSTPCLHPRTLSGRLHPSWTGRCRMREVCEDCGKVMRHFVHGVQVRAASLPLASVVSRLSLPRILRGCAAVSSLLWSPASPGLPVPLLRNGTEYYVCDGARNVVELRDAQGAVTDTYAYSPFGACVHAGGYYKDNGLYAIALRDMVFEAVNAGVPMNTSRLPSISGTLVPILNKERGTSLSSFTRQRTFDSSIQSTWLRFSP